MHLLLIFAKIMLVYDYFEIKLKFENIIHQLNIVHLIDCNLYFIFEYLTIYLSYLT